MRFGSNYPVFRLSVQFVMGAVLVLAQAPNPTQTNLPDAAASPYPVFRITAVSRSVKAINYNHRQGSTVLAFEGTNLAKGAKGEARVDSKTGATRINVSFDKMPPPQDLGSEFLTYVLWAVSPEGRFENLGEVYLNGDNAKLFVTTEMQAFGMIVTAEPYYAVTQPSDVVVLENVIVSNSTESTVGTISPIEAKYDLMQRGIYNSLLPEADRNLTKQDRSDSPLDLKEARHALAIATTLGARQYAADTMNKASIELSNAEAFWKSSKDKKKVQSLARVSTQLSEDARLITIKRREEESLDMERAASERKLLSTQAEVRDEAGKRLRATQESEESRQAELEAQTRAQSALAAAAVERQAAERARAEAMAAKSDAERAQIGTLEAKRQLEEAKMEALKDKQGLEAGQAEARRMAMEADAQRLAAGQEAQRQIAEADAKRIASEQESQRQLASQRLEAQKELERLQAEKQLLREELRRQFNLILETRDTARGLVVNMSDVLFDTAKYTLRVGAREKLAKISGIVLAHPGLKLEVEGNTDSVGTPEYNQTLSERRAQAVRDYLVAQGLPSNMISSKGMGENNPVADNMNAQGRQQNRRVEMIVSGDVITRTITMTTSPTASVGAQTPR
jgi:outer membrane protein OmpA-like peptidoglycan-associated protein